MPYASGLEVLNYFKQHRTLAKQIEVIESKKGEEQKVMKKVATKSVNEAINTLKSFNDNESIKALESIVRSEPSFQKKNSDKYLVRRQATGMVTVKVPESEYLTVTVNKGVLTITKSTPEDLKNLAKPVVRKRKIKAVE